MEALYHFAGLPGNVRTKHDCAPEYLRRRIIHPHPNPLELEERAVPLTSILSLAGERKPARTGSPEGEGDQGSDFSEAPPVPAAPDVSLSNVAAG